MKELIFRADDLAPGKRRASVELTYQVINRHMIENTA
jgi:hypothetical protein